MPVKEFCLVPIAVVMVEKSTKPEGIAPELSLVFSADVIVEKLTKPEGMVPELSLVFNADVMVEKSTDPDPPLLTPVKPAPFPMK